MAGISVTPVQPEEIKNAHELEEALNKLNDDFNTELHKNKKYKWYSPRIGNLVIPQVYDDSLSYYEAINKLNLLLHCEIERAMNAENLLGISLDAEIQRAKQAEADLTAALKNEVNRAEAAEEHLDNEINAETNRAKSAEQVLTTNLNDEIARAKQAESDLNNALNAEIDRAKAAEQANTKLINDETARATNKETELDTAIKTENTRATGREDALNTAINTETTRATNKETELNSAIEAEAARAKAEEAKAVTNVTMESNAHTHVFKKTINGVTTDIGEIDTDEGNPVVEVKDSVVENAASGFDFHTLSETTADGTSNNIGQAYLAKKQVTDISLSNDSLNVKTVDQTGKEETASHEVVTPATLQEVENELKAENTLSESSITAYLSDNVLQPYSHYRVTITAYLTDKLPDDVYLSQIIADITPRAGYPQSEGDHPEGPQISISNYQALDGIPSNRQYGFRCLAEVQTFKNKVSLIELQIRYLNKGVTLWFNSATVKVEKYPLYLTSSSLDYVNDRNTIIESNDISLKAGEYIALRLRATDESGTDYNNKLKTLCLCNLTSNIKLFYNENGTDKNLDVTQYSYYVVHDDLFGYTINVTFRANSDLVIKANTAHADLLTLDCQAIHDGDKTIILKPKGLIQSYAFLQK